MENNFDALKLENQLCFPLLKKLEAKEYVKRFRSREDERNLLVSITDKGEKLKEQAIEVPAQMSGCVNLQPEEAMQLYELLYKILKSL